MEPRPRRLLPISKAAARLGVHPDTLRAWADRGLVAVIRTPTGYRRFEPQEIERVRAEMGLKGNGAAVPDESAG
ncbi:MAG: MerR family DNA-binding transcriptional regulator [Chloroflexia bacterium]|nr:MerR family DNA-binding transcriptional regulator [Chloroflexia bacterium]